MKIKVGILFGGKSREREIAFAGGRTVYDNLNKSIFEPIPIFIDSFNNFILLNWECVYKGSIRDFYPNSKTNDSQIPLYAESLSENFTPEELAEGIGQIISVDTLKASIDIAFLALHGPYGEDGRLQGLLEYFDIPYTGSGIYSSAIGISKQLQKELQSKLGILQPHYITIKREAWLNNEVDLDVLAEKLIYDIDFPCVVKASTQGSSVGISIVQGDDNTKLQQAIDKAFFISRLTKSEWESFLPNKREEWLLQLIDIRESLGLPVRINETVIYRPEALINKIVEVFNHQETIIIEACDTEAEIIIESFIDGKEFSSIVIEDLDGTPICLPPTEIRKGKELFDYRSKYLPGLSRKITPIELEFSLIEKIRTATIAVYKAFKFNVYARIDGFITKDGTVFLNDPNTTSGMMPASFFFHQAAEIGLNPSEFLTYIVYKSLQNRIIDFKYNGVATVVLQRLQKAIDAEKKRQDKKIRVGIVLGGYSSERHISVESGRNIYEKLVSSDKYLPTPIFLTGDDRFYSFYKIPINVLLKDNADDILEKVKYYEQHPIVQKIIEECSTITEYFAFSNQLFKPYEYELDELKQNFDFIFIALHGRPGEDGSLQAKLDSIGIPYNGSSSNVSSITIDKYRTNEILRVNNFLVADHLVVKKEEWLSNKDLLINILESRICYPLIAKPIDDGCSSAVKKIKNRAELEAFAQLIFRKNLILEGKDAALLGLKLKEEFPLKNEFLVESLITANGAAHFLEITGGMLCHKTDKGVVYEIFEASETLSTGDVLSLEEKFLAGQGLNITPARYSKNPLERQRISDEVKETLLKVIQTINVEGYCRVDAFVRVYENGKIETIIIEINSLPGMTPATCIFHQCAVNNYKPFQFIDKIIDFGLKK